VGGQIHRSVGPCRNCLTWTSEAFCILSGVLVRHLYALKVCVDLSGRSDSLLEVTQSLSVSIYEH